MLMTEGRSPSSAFQACLDRAYASSQKGGTLIAEDVWDLETHEGRLGDPDGYRPEKCPRCGCWVHVHDLRPRRLLNDPAVSTEVIRYRCADRAGCGAVWLIVPAFLARHLWRGWATVEAAMDAPGRSEVPERTRRRWKARLASTARQLVAILTTAADAVWGALAAAVGLDAYRLDLVRSYRAHLQPDPGRCLAELAGGIHRLSPGVRLL
jgi:hypothetical protein